MKSFFVGANQPSWRMKSSKEGKQLRITFVLSKHIDHSNNYNSVAALNHGLCKNISCLILFVSCSLLQETP